MKWFVGVFVGFVLVYGAWVGIAMTRTATISVDYVAKLNETASAVPEEDRAWPIYRDASIALKEHEMPSSVFYDNDVEEPQWPSDEGWEYFEHWLQTHEDTLALIREGANKNGFGFVLQGRVQEEDKELWPDKFASQSEEKHDEFVFSILLPQLRHMRGMVQLLSIDAKAAAFEGDAERCVSAIDAMLRIGTHVREHPLFISDLVSFSLYNFTFSTIGKILVHDSTVFTSAQFGQLEDLLANLDDYLQLRLVGERYFMYDLLQRMYTDNGNGDGSLVPLEANRIMASLTSDLTEGSLTPALFIPVMDVFASSRKELKDEFDSRMDIAEQHSGVPLYELKAMPNAFGEQLYTAPRSAIDPYFLINLLMPALDQAILQGEYTRAKRDATLAALYAVQVFNKTGEWPTDLVSAGVVDAWSGAPFLITANNGSPLIYSVGFNQLDDGGVHNDDAQRWSAVSTGDWVLWPSLE
ncbi:MAG: hypothetical protein ACI9JK_001742 [Phycisphaerales bacterium]|jgi:hypothetical protein